MNGSVPSSQHAGSQSGQSTAGQVTSGTAGSAGDGPKALVRASRNRMLAGVASGIAEYSGLDVTLIRVAFVLVTLIGGLGIPLYLASWLLIPAEDSAQSIAAGLAGDVREWRN